MILHYSEVTRQNKIRAIYSNLSEFNACLATKEQLEWRAEKKAENIEIAKAQAENRERSKDWSEKNLEREGVNSNRHKIERARYVHTSRACSFVVCLVLFRC